MNLFLKETSARNSDKELNIYEDSDVITAVLLLPEE